jgi:hypothetical protein
MEVQKMKNPFSRFFIKDYVNISDMANDNNNQPAQPAATRTATPAADGETQSSNGAPNKQKVVAVDAKGNAIETKGQDQAPKPEVKKQDGDLDIDKLITESTKEIKTGNEAQSARKKKKELLDKALNSRMYIEPITFKNVETDEFVGSKMRYTKDKDGKTIYDYMQDPEVTAHIKFKVPEGDPRDGSPVTKQISISWVNPVY